MSWFLLILIATGLFSLVNILDKFLCSQKFKNNYAFAAVTNLFGWLFLIGIIPFTNFANSSGWPLFFALLSGPVYLLMWLLFWKALEKGEVSRVSAIFNVRPMFTSLLAVFFLAEIINSQKWLGIILVIIGAILASYEGKTEGKNRFNRAYLLVIFSAFSAALADILSKFALVKISPFGVYFWSALATLPIIFLFLTRKAVKNEIRNNLKDKQSLISLLLRGFVSVVAVCFFYLALGKGPASLVVTVGASGPIFVFLFSIIVSHFWPKFLKEELTKSVLIAKALAILLIVGGVVLINF